MKFDSRIIPIRNDLASIEYKGLIKSKKFSNGTNYFLRSSSSPLYSKKNSNELASQLLYGEIFRVFDVSGKFAWGQSLRDNYVGYTPIESLSSKKIKATHKIQSLRALIYKKPQIKQSPIMYLSLNSLVNVKSKEGKFSFLENLGWIFSGCISPINNFNFNVTELAIQYLNTPYLWGGRDSIGIDCSGLIQNIYQMVGINMPRDTDLQELFFADEIFSETKIKAGDLIFWKGHVAMALDNKNIIHANAYHMKTSIETLKHAKVRIAKQYGRIIKISRPSNI